MVIDELIHRHRCPVCAVERVCQMMLCRPGLQTEVTDKVCWSCVLRGAVPRPK